MDQFRVIRTWTFKEWNQTLREDRPRGAIPYGHGWVLLEPVPRADGTPIPGPLEPPGQPQAGPPAE